MFDEGGTGEVSNTGSKDTRVFLKNIIQWLMLVGQRSLWARQLDKVCLLTGFGEVLVWDISCSDSWTSSMTST